MICFFDLVCLLYLVSCILLFMSRGFTALELLLVIGIVAGLSAISVPAYRDYQIRSDLNIAAEQITQALGRARLLSQAGKHETTWGYHVSSSTLFAGGNFASRNALYDERYSVPATIGLSGLPEVTFSRLEGRPSATGTIILTSLRGEAREVDIVLDARGIAINASDRLTVCHCQASPPHTLQIPDNAWPAHRKHGDYLGACQMPDTRCDD